MYSNKSLRVFLQTLFLIATISFVSGIQMFTVTPEKDTTVYINKTQGSSCNMCTKVPGNKPERQCYDNLPLNKNTPVTIEFHCSRPQDVFIVEIVRNIACTSTSCGRIIQSDFGSSGLLDFPRRFTWKIKAYPQKSFQINFAKTGLSQIAPTDSCNDKHTYTLRAADVLLGKYCSSGPISNAQILNQGSFSLDLPAGQRLGPGQFDVSVVEKIDTSANISVTLQEGSLSSTLMSPNYPRSFPNDDVMEWYFQVPSKHKAAIKFMNLTLPTCLKKQTEVEYSSRGKTQVGRLDEIQPVQNEGSFSLRLRNCEMDTTRSGSAGLSMRFNVSAYQGIQILTVKPEKDTTIYITKTKPNSCKVCNFTKVQGNIPKRQCYSNLTLNENTPGTIEFDCPRPQEEFTVEIVHNIECTSTLCGRIIQSDGGSSGLLDFSRRFTWEIKAYQQKSFQINFAEKGLSQIAPTDSCNDKHTYTLRAADVLLGKYCSSGPISNAQILNQGSFSLDLPAGQKPKPHQFHVSVGEKINTIANISVTLLKESFSTLMSPNYPRSFPDNAVMEWYFQVPSKHKAAIKLLNLTLPTCLKDQTGVEYSNGGKPQVVRLDEVQPVQNEGSFSLRLRNCKMDTRRSGSAGLSVKFNVSAYQGVKILTVTPEKDTTVYINNTEARSCKVCKVTKVPGNLPDRQCYSNLTLSSTTTVTLEFDCLRTQDAFTMEIVRNIACTSKSCGRITQSDISSSDLLDFHRIFTWKIKAYPQKSFQINFAENGLRQIAPTDSCNDKHTYTLRAADVLLGKYCSSGPISNAQILNQGSFSLDLPAGQKLRPHQFDVFVVEEIPIIANISVTLLKESSSTLMSPNYPRSFPDNDVMEWYFQVPNEHKAAIKLLNLTLPTCLKKKIALEYSSRGKPQAQVVRLDKVQPEQNEGSFSLRLRNCEMDTRRSGSAGLSMKFNVSAYQGVQILTVKPEKNTTIYINNTKASSCKVCNYKEVPGNIPKQQCHSNLTLNNNTPVTIAFDCSRPQDEFTVEIVHNIECTSNSCAQIIQSDGGFPDFLNFSRRFTWKIKAYPQKSFQINFAEKGLSQIAPTDSCNDKHTYTLRAADVLLGKYCSSGPISNAQILNQGSFSLDLPAGQKPKPHQFHVSVGEKINTIANISVTLLKGSMSSTLMLPIYRDNVPNGGMEWYFQVPDKHNATIKFLNHILPNCSDKQMELEYTGSKGTTQVVRLDDLQPIQNQGSFTLRLRNCKVVHTRASTNQGAKLKPILGAVAALFLISIIVLSVVCFVIKKKRKGQSPAVAAENPDRNVPKEPNNHPEDCNDRNHVYATIDDSLVYSHLLNKLKGGEHYDSYQSLDIKPKKPSVYEDVGGDSSVPLLQSKQGQPLSNKASSYVELVVVNNVYDLEQNNQEECPSLEPHLELKGEN